MSNSTRRGGENQITMQEYTYLCPECAQEIDVNSEMRNAILTNGCPVCAADVEKQNFE